MTVRALRFKHVQDIQFLSTFHRQMMNINEHLINFGGYFYFIFVTTENKYITFRLNQTTRHLTEVKINNPVIEILDKNLVSGGDNKNNYVVIEDLFQINQPVMIPQLQRCYQELFTLAGFSINRTFRHCNPD